MNISEQTLVQKIIIQRPKSPHHEVGTHQRQGKREEGKTREKGEEKEMNRGTEGEILNPIPGN